MCGRARCSLSREEIRAEATVSRWRDEAQYFPSFNVAPSKSTPVVKQVDGSGDLELHTMKWGLVPSYTKPGEKLDFFRMFNARSETVAEKGVFKKLLSRQRCVVLMNGFYEWKKEGKHKQPYYIFQDGRAAMHMAGLFDVWRAEEEPIYSFTILTTDSSDKLRWLHDRMPVILANKAAEELWLGAHGDQAMQKLEELCRPYNGEDLQWFPVDPVMSNSARDGPECCQPLKRPSITSFFKPASERKSVVSDQADPPPKDAKGSTEVKLEQPDVKIEEGPRLCIGNEAKGEPDDMHAPDGAQYLAGDVEAFQASSAAKDAQHATAVDDVKGDKQANDTHNEKPKGGNLVQQGSRGQKRPLSSPNPKSKRAKAPSSDPQQGKITSFFTKNSA